MSGIPKQQTFRIGDTLYKGNRSILTTDNTIQTVGKSKTWDCSHLRYMLREKFNVGGTTDWKIHSINATVGINSTRFLFDDTKWTNNNDYPVTIYFVGNQSMIELFKLTTPINTGHSLLYTHYECSTDKRSANYTSFNIYINLLQLASNFITDGEMMLDWDVEITTETLELFYMNSRQVLREKLADTCFSFRDSGFKRKI